MIPKVIHYCWLSGEPFPTEIKECIRSWKRKLPDYKLRLWTQDSLDISSVPFVFEAIKEKKWAFACDYIRLYALYHEGGVYFDCDVFVKKNIDFCLSNRFFSAMECYPDLITKLYDDVVIDHDGLILDTSKSYIHGIQIQAAIMGSEKGHPYVKDCMHYYESNHFILEDSKLNMEIISPFVLAKCAEKYGFRYVNHEQLLDDGIRLYPIELFPPNMDLITKEAFAIHCCAGSWRQVFKNDNITSIVILKCKRILKNILFFFHLKSNNWLRV